MKQKPKIVNSINKMRCKISYIMILLFLFYNRVVVFAGDTKKEESSGNKIQDSTAGKGLINLINDASLFLLVLSPIVGGLLAVYFFIRKNAADEQDQKQWNKRLIITGICVVGAVLVTSTITVVTGYFK